MNKYFKAPGREQSPSTELKGYAHPLLAGLSDGAQLFFTRLCLASSEDGWAIYDSKGILFNQMYHGDEKRYGETPEENAAAYKRFLRECLRYDDKGSLVLLSSQEVPPFIRKSKAQRKMKKHNETTPPERHRIIWVQRLEILSVAKLARFQSRVPWPTEDQLISVKGQTLGNLPGAFQPTQLLMDTPDFEASKIRELETIAKVEELMEPEPEPEVEEEQSLEDFIAEMAADQEEEEVDILDAIADIEVLATSEDDIDYSLVNQTAPWMEIEPTQEEIKTMQAVESFTKTVSIDAENLGKIMEIITTQQPDDVPTEKQVEQAILKAEVNPSHVASYLKYAKIGDYPGGTTIRRFEGVLEAVKW